MREQPDATGYLRRMVFAAVNPVASKWEKGAARKMIADLESARSRGHLRNDESVTQLGGPSRFRAMPRFETELDVSAIRGVMDAETAARATYARPASTRDHVRHLRVDRLRQHGYAVVDTSHGRNPLHASIFAPLDLGPDEARLWWENGARVTLDTIAEAPSAREEGAP